MIFTEKEEKTSKLLFNKVEELKTTNFIFIYGQELILEVTLEDFYDSDNGEEYGSKDYEEFNEWVVHIKKIVSDKDNIIKGKEFLVLNYKNFPKEISTLQGKVIYKKN